MRNQSLNELCEMCKDVLNPDLTHQKLRSLNSQLPSASVNEVVGASRQILKLAPYLDMSYWTSLMACCLINGVVPPENGLDDNDVLTTFDAKDIALSNIVTISGARIHQIRKDLRDWRNSDSATGLIRPAAFFAWCVVEEIDTNYLRLLREIAGLGSGHPVGPLPLRDIERYKVN
ncbi:hypothetical protein [Paraburkholderia sp. BCC1886]|uniref:hypothetical protein n=1 Tax=Paraburkholderia sp. BCC1886 TaxID=2562670 RepID=UPI001182A183|nr:hypothetical protein [Paraburkholderia sp. BCC1886]